MSRLLLLWIWTAGVAIALAITAVRDGRPRACLGYSQPISAPDLVEKAWSLPVAARPTIVSEEKSTGFMMGYPTEGTTILELGPFRLRRDWTQSGNDAHSMGPRHVRLSLAPREGTWGAETGPIFDGKEYFPLDAEVRDGGDGRVLVVIINAARATSSFEPRGELLPKRTGITYPIDENRGFAFRVGYHAGGDRFLHLAALIIAATALAFALIAIAVPALRRRPSWSIAAAFALAFASIQLAMTWF